MNYKETLIKACFDGIKQCRLSLASTKLLLDDVYILNSLSDKQKRRIRKHNRIVEDFLIANPGTAYDPNITIKELEKFLETVQYHYKRSDMFFTRAIGYKKERKSFYVTFIVNMNDGIKEMKDNSDTIWTPKWLEKDLMFDTFEVKFDSIIGSKFGRRQLPISSQKRLKKLAGKSIIRHEDKKRNALLARYSR